MPSGRGVESQGSDVHAHSYNIVHALADGQAGWGTTPVVAAVGRKQEEEVQMVVHARTKSKSNFTAEFVGRSYCCVSTGRIR